MNDLNPTNVPKIRKHKSRVKKPKGSDIKWSNLYGNQATHFNGYIKNPNAKNFYYNHKKTPTTFDARQ
jgi:hypothetical protein